MPKKIKIEECNECDNQLPYAFAGCLYTLGKSLVDSSDEIKYEGDISDLGNEVGYQLGQILKNMTETQIRDFIHGLKHGISLTNGTH
jgi:hypothetical protein